MRINGGNGKSTPGAEASKLMAALVKNFPPADDDQKASMSFGGFLVPGI
jgi:hypothetical protein